MSFQVTPFYKKLKNVFEYPQTFTENELCQTFLRICSMTEISPYSYPVTGAEEGILANIFKIKDSTYVLWKPEKSETKLYRITGYDQKEILKVYDEDVPIYCFKIPDPVDEGIEKIKSMKDPEKKEFFKLVHKEGQENSYLAKEQYTLIKEEEDTLLITDKGKTLYRLTPGPSGHTMHVHVNGTENYDLM